MDPLQFLSLEVRSLFGFIENGDLLDNRTSYYFRLGGRFRHSELRVVSLSNQAWSDEPLSVVVVDGKRRVEICKAIRTRWSFLIDLPMTPRQVVQQ